MDSALVILFWTGAAVLAYTFLGYPAVIHFVGKIRATREHSPTPDTPPPTVSIVLVVRNEARRIASRIENLLDTSHPAKRIEVIVVSDGSTDGTAEQVRNSAHPATLIAHADHRGKPACLNDGVAAATGELVVFADARQRFTPSTIPVLAAAFADPAVGAASGELRIDPSAQGVAAGVDAYWRLEKAIRLGESRLDSTIGCTGAVYAIRRSIFQPLPEDTLVDDLVCPMQIAMRGMRVLFCPGAVAFDPQRLEPASETRRKRRTLAGNFQMLFRYPGWLLPWKNRLWIQLVSHKYLRLTAPLLMVATLGLGIILAARGSPFFTIVSAAQCLFYFMAVIGALTPRPAWKCFSLPAGFVFLNVMTVPGFIDYFRRRNKGGW